MKFLTKKGCINWDDSVKKTNAKKRAGCEQANKMKEYAFFN